MFSEILARILCGLHARGDLALSPISSRMMQTLESMPIFTLQVGRRAIRKLARVDCAWAPCCLSGNMSSSICLDAPAKMLYTQLQAQAFSIWRSSTHHCTLAFPHASERPIGFSNTTCSGSLQVAPPPLPPHPDHPSNTPRGSVPLQSKHVSVSFRVWNGLQCCSRLDTSAFWAKRGSRGVWTNAFCSWSPDCVLAYGDLSQGWSSNPCNEPHMDQLHWDGWSAGSRCQHTEDAAAARDSRCTR